MLALEDRFDTIIGVEGRRWLYHEVFKDTKRFTPYNLTGVPGWERRVFPFVLAPAKLYINRYLDIDDATAARALELVDAELDAVAELLSDGRRYLVGDRFSAADLAFAALCAPLVVPAEYGTPAAAARRHARRHGRPRPRRGASTPRAASPRACSPSSAARPQPRSAGGGGADCASDDATPIASATPSAGRQAADDAAARGAAARRRRT